MAGASDAERFATDQVNRLLQGVSFQFRRTLKSPDADSIHDLRVAIRRFGQALAVFKQWFTSGRVRSIRTELKTVLSAAGDVRDCDIAAEVLSKSDADDAAACEAEMQTRRKTAERRLVGALRRWVTQKRGAKWRTELAALETPEEFQEQSPDDLAYTVIPRIAKAFCRSGNRAVDSKASGRAMHQLRIETKKIRYTIELFQESYGAGAKDRIEQLRAVQTVLGNANDLRATRKLVTELGAGRKLADALRKKQRKKIREFHGLWEKDFSREATRQWIQFFRQPPRKPAARSATSVSAKRATAPATPHKAAGVATAI